MGRSLRLFAALALFALSLLSLTGVVVAPAAAAPNSANAPTPPPAPARSSQVAWPAPRVRIEPIDGTAGVEIAGVGVFRGAIDVVRNGRALAVVNEVAFEDYVRGISEVSSAWPFEALKAQAIAARTYALWEYKRHGAGEYRAVGADICATQSCQVYTGLKKERAEYGERWAAAVEQTRSQVLWWQNGPIVAKYSSSNGGEMVPGGRPYLRAAPDPDDKHSPLHRWEVVVPAGPLARAVGLAGSVVAIQRVGDDVLVTAKNDPTDPFEEPSYATMHAFDFRDRLNATIPAPAHVPRTLPTGRFDPEMRVDDGTVVFRGRGWGHGIGMSQWGAYGKALRGMKAPDILAAYYAGLRPVELPDAHVPKTIKVAVALDAGNVTVAPSDPGGRLRVLAEGTPIAHGSGGTWWLRPASDGVTVAPTAGEEGPATVALKTDPQLRVGDPAEVRLHLSDHAVFTARATMPGHTDAVPLGEPQVFAAGDVVLRMPVPTAAGPYTITVDTDRGGGRTTSTVLTVDVAPLGGPIDQSTDAPAAGRAGAVAASTAVAPGTLFAWLAVAFIVGVAITAVRTAFSHGRTRPVH